MTEVLPLLRIETQSSGFVAALPAEIRKKLIDRGRPKTVKKGQIIQQRGDRARVFWAIESGTVDIGRFRLDGKFNIFARLGDGESFGELAFIGEFLRQVDAIAVVDSRLIEIGERELVSLLESDSGSARIMLKALAHLMQGSLDLIEESRNLSAVKRLALALARLSDKPDSKVEISVTQQELADLVGISRVSLGKGLAELAGRGFVERCYGKIRITDVSAMLNFAQS